jgi:hypothetical protein
MMTWMLALALGGEMYVGVPMSPPGVFDGRELTYRRWGDGVLLLPPTFVQGWALTLHRANGNLYTCYVYSPLTAGSEEFRYMYWSQDGFPHDLGACLYIDSVSTVSTYYNPHTTTIESTGQYYPREWIDPLDMAVGWNGTALEGLRADGTIVPLDNSVVLSHLTGVVFVAWDGDTKLIWVFGNDNYTPIVLALAPDSGQVVAELLDTDFGNVGTGYLDTTPAQTPELLVTGQCPGTVYVTVVDGTPGGRATVASGTMDGVSVSPSGPCAGTESHIADPRRQSNLRVSSYGIASTTFQSTPDQCGTMKLQAVDLATCLTTAVRTVPATVP